MKKVPASLVAGDQGEQVARLALMRIGWATPAKVAQDIGDDLITFARVRASAGDPEDLWDLEAPVLAQVKASLTAYKAPSGKHEGRSGWWYRDKDASHFDHWLSFGLPYLLLLADLSSGDVFWEHVESHKVIGTGKGRRIFVPADQRVDESSLDSLNRVAVHRRINSVEGRIWDGGYHQLPSNARLRHALVVPRLIAPHPNRSDSNVGYEQAIASILRSGEHHLAHLERNGLCPSMSSWSSHRLWGWRFAAAVREVVRTGDCAPAIALVRGAPSAAERDAALAVIAPALYAAGDADQALITLKCRPSTNPADRGWILALRAQVLLDLDRPDDASRAAQEALFALKALDGDLSVSAIRGSCASLIYATAGLGNGDLRGAISAQDNVSSWWRAQNVSYALGMDLADRFRGWGRDALPALAESRSVNQLNAVAWSAAFGASWGNWRHHMVQLAQIALISRHDEAEAREALHILVSTGAKDEAKTAATRLWFAGPAEALRDVAVDLTASPWPIRQEGAIMAVLTAAGDLLAEDQADAAATRIIRLIEDDGPDREFAGGWTDRWSEIDKALSELLSAAPVRTHEAVAEFTMSHFGESEREAMALVRIADRLDLAALTDTTLSRLTDVALSRDDHHGPDLLATLGQHHQPARDALSSFAHQGRPGANRDLLASGASDKSTWAALGRELRPKVDAMLEDASAGGYARGHDLLLDLTRAAYHTGNTQSWKKVTTALGHRSLATWQVTGTIAFLAQYFDELPAVVQRRLRNVPDRTSTSRGLLDDPNSFSASLMNLRLATGQLDDAELMSTLFALLRSDPQRAVQMLRLWKDPRSLPFLTGLLLGGHAVARADAAHAVIGIAGRSSIRLAELVPALARLAELSEGCYGAVALADAVRTSQSADLGALHRVLADHPSAKVRSALGVSRG